MSRPRKRQIPRLTVAANLERDLQRLTQWLEARRIKAMLLGRPERALTVGRTNERLYGWYDKARTHRMAPSPGLLLLREAERRGLVRQSTFGRWEDIRHKSTIGGAIGRKEAGRRPRLMAETTGDGLLWDQIPQ